MASSTGFKILNLPSELVVHILSFLDPEELVQAAKTCRPMNTISKDDTLWLRFLRSDAPDLDLSTPTPEATYRDLYLSHLGHWHIARNKIWISSSEPTGKVLLSRYSRSRNVIEAYGLSAEQGPHDVVFWQGNTPNVIMHSFNPTVSLDVSTPIMKLDPWMRWRPPKTPPVIAETEEGELDRTQWEPFWQKELRMDIPSLIGAGGTVNHTLLLTSRYPTDIITNVWPPNLIPAPKAQRVRVFSPSKFKDKGHRPKRLADLCESSFRVRKWAEFGGRRDREGGGTFSWFRNTHGSFPANLYSSVSLQGFSPNNRIGEDVHTFATMTEDTYLPTAAKPYQGVWVGDYSGHGCEFLLIMQWTEDELADGSRPLPERALEVLEEGSTISENEDWTITENGDSTTSGNEDAVDDSPEFRVPPYLGSDRSPVAGRLEAVKLTGDANVPRGEYTFIAPDIGEHGTIRIADEELFQGARFVKSVGHIASHGFREEKFVASQLILISENLLAQYWECLGHISHYKRVDIGRFSEAD